MHRITAPQTRLLSHQTRLIHAHEGMRLRVVCGRLWLTQPNMAQDLFLVPGDCIDLKQDWVVVGADAEPPSDPDGLSSYSAYELQPLGAAQAGSDWMGSFRLAVAGLRARVAGGWNTAIKGLLVR